MRPVLTRRQRSVLDFLQERAAQGHAPTLSEVCRALGLRSRGSLHKQVRELVRAGLVEPVDGRKRGLRLTERAGTGEEIPVLGRIAAGRPLEAVSCPEGMTVPAMLRGRGESYVLEVRGDSMAEEGILDGDRVVVEHRSHARNGDLVVALIDGGEATLKRLEQTPEAVVLHPANPAYHPMVFAPGRVRIQGVVTGLVRRYPRSS